MGRLELAGRALSERGEPVTVVAAVWRLDSWKGIESGAEEVFG